VVENERLMILIEAHDAIAGGHYIGKDTTKKILHAGMWWSTLYKDVKEYC